MEKKKRKNIFFSMKVVFTFLGTVENMFDKKKRELVVLSHSDYFVHRENIRVVQLLLFFFFGKRPHCTHFWRCGGTLPGEKKKLIRMN